MNKHVLNVVNELLVDFDFLSFDEKIDFLSRGYGNISYQSRHVVKHAGKGNKDHGRDLILKLLCVEFIKTYIVEELTLPFFDVIKDFVFGEFGELFDVHLFSVVAETTEIGSENIAVVEEEFNAIKSEGKVINLFVFWDFFLWLL